jgi:hypothetical protein
MGRNFESWCVFDREKHIDQAATPPAADIHFGAISPYKFLLTQQSEQLVPSRFPEETTGPGRDPLLLACGQ